MNKKILGSERKDIFKIRIGRFEILLQEVLAEFTTPEGVIRSIKRNSPELLEGGAE